MITLNYSGGVKLAFQDPSELAKWFAEKERLELERAMKTKARKEQLQRKSRAATYAEVAALLSSATIN